MSHDYAHARPAGSPSLTTPDPNFNPDFPLLVNGYGFVSLTETFGLLIDCLNTLQVFEEQFTSKVEDQTARGRTEKAVLSRRKARRCTLLAHRINAFFQFNTDNAPRTAGTAAKDGEPTTPGTPDFGRVGKRTIDALREAIWDTSEAEARSAGLDCRMPPEGWTCSRAAGHDGPCAASPIEQVEESTRRVAERLFGDALDTVAALGAGREDKSPPRWNRDIDPEVTDALRQNYEGGEDAPTAIGVYTEKQREAALDQITDDLVTTAAASGEWGPVVDAIAAALGLTKAAG